MLVPHSAILAKRLVTGGVACERRVTGVVAMWRRQVGTRHSLQPLTMLSLFAPLLLPLCTLLLLLCTLPRPIDEVQPVRMGGGLRRHLVPRAPVDDRDAPVLLIDVLALELVRV